MVKEPKSEASSQTLVDQFVAFAVEQGTVIANDDTRRGNWLFDKLAAIERILVARGDKRMLLPLLQHPDPWVRLIVARKVFAEVPEIARQVLEELKASKVMPASLQAASSLGFLDDGIWVPK
jgi:hypothetical protein